MNFTKLLFEFYLNTFLHTDHHTTKTKREQWDMAKVVRFILHTFHKLKKNTWNLMEFVTLSLDPFIHLRILLPYFPWLNNCNICYQQPLWYSYSYWSEVLLNFTDLIAMLPICIDTEYISMWFGPLAIFIYKLSKPKCP